MSHTIELPHNMARCPIWWQNFMGQTFRGSTPAPIGVLEINDKLKPYNAHMHLNKNGRINDQDFRILNDLTFESEEDYVMFILRWS